MTADRNNERSLAAQVKSLIPDPVKRIELDDFINTELRSAINALSLDHFPAKGVVNKEEFIKRIEAYDSAVKSLRTIAILTARWANAEQTHSLEKIVCRLADVDKGDGGIVVWLRLGWYPLLVVLYAVGITTLATHNYKLFHRVMMTRVSGLLPLLGRNEAPVIIPVLSEITNIADSFKLLPDREREYLPRSEHLFDVLRAELDEALFLGSRYEYLFDRFEMLTALIFADSKAQSGESFWAPPGRFCWKHRGSAGPMRLLLSEASEGGENWPPLKAGLFGGSPERFLEVANACKSSLDRSSRW